MLYEKILEARSLSSAYNEQHLIETSVEDIIHSLIDNFVLAKAGARLLTGLEGNVKISRIKNGSEVDWKIENGLSNESDLLFDGFTLTPHRLTCYVDISDQLLIQSKQNVIDFLLYEIGRKMAVKLQTAILSNTQISNAPRKIYTKGIQTLVYDEMSYEKILECVEKIDLEGLTGDICCIGNTSMKKSLRQTFIPSSGLSILNSGKIDNYEFYTCADSGALYIGDFSQVVIGMWDKANVYVDTLSQKDKGITRITVNAYFDYGLMHPTQIAALYTQAEKDEASSGEVVVNITDFTTWDNMIGKSLTDEPISGFIAFGQSSDKDTSEDDMDMMGFHDDAIKFRHVYPNADWIFFNLPLYSYNFDIGAYAVQLADDADTTSPGLIYAMNGEEAFKYKMTDLDDTDVWYELLEDVQLKINGEWISINGTRRLHRLNVHNYSYRKGDWSSKSNDGSRFILDSASALFISITSGYYHGFEELKLFDENGRRLFTDLRVLVSNMDGSYKYLYATETFRLLDALGVNKAIDTDEGVVYYDENGDVIEIE